ncbi:STAS domain-containing protein [Actinomadura sp. 7K507]|uniref:STAS domain-containing protein n=1 Tax=Actinomadura sp. 7K507 TaxID=2530365 RepID=UPI001051C285|nr:STAS domain-containing protein [Actinomadura sp. 7K507]TDC91570.1 STAS domain-containing protein [Actinomadura sp. 7K507]
MTERGVECAVVPVNSGGGRSPGGDDSGFVVEGVRVRSALLRLDGVFEPPYLVVDGEIDISTLAPFTTALSSMLEHGYGDVWIDVEKLSFIDVGGLRALAAAACRLHIQDRRLVLRSVAPHLVKLMDLVGWSQIPSLFMLARETGPSSSGSRARRPGPRAHDD